MVNNTEQDKTFKKVWVTGNNYMNNESLQIIIKLFEDKRGRKGKVD